MTYSGSVMSCTTCAGESVPNAFSTGCATCNGSATYCASTGQCMCPQNMFLVEVSPDGYPLDAKYCTPCPAQTSFPSRTCSSSLVGSYVPTQCDTCSPPLQWDVASSTCKCPSSAPYQVGKECVAATASNGIPTAVQHTLSVYSISFPSVIVSSGATSSRSVNSYIFQQLYMPALINCSRAVNTGAAAATNPTLAEPTAGQRRGCQALANLCALLIYDDSSLPCRAYAQLKNSASAGTNGEDEWPDQMPWLDYTSADSVLQASLSTTVSFFGDASVMKYLLAKYTVEGTFVEFVDVTTELQLCSGDALALSRYLKFGTSMTYSCNVDLRRFLEETQLYLYDMYIQTGDGNVQGVPVRMVDYSNGGTPNVNDPNVENAENDDIFKRRFFLVDSITGRTAAVGSDLKSGLEVLRYAKSMTLSVKKNSDGSLLLPILTIDYESVDSAVVPSGTFASSIYTYLVDTTLESTSEVAVSFTSQYSMDTAAFWQAMLVLFIICIIFVMLGWILRLFVFMRRRPGQPIGASFLFRLLVYLFSSYATIFFWFLAVIAFYFLVFFKMQGDVFVLLPPEVDQRSFMIMMVVATFAQFLYVLFLVWEQSQVDIFFVDWEKSHGKLLVGSGAGEDGDEREMEARKGKRRAQYIQAPVSAWRSFFVVNEWNELQTSRPTSTPMTLLVLIFLLEGLDLIYVATPQPNLRDLTPDVTNEVLRFGLITFFWLAIVIVQLAWKYGIAYRFISDPIGQFVDLLSLANISVFVFDDKVHGWYLHGKSVHKHADTTMEEMAKQFKAEASNSVAKRGLNSDEDLQSFEIFVTKSFRERYDATFPMGAEAARQTVKRGNAPPSRQYKDAVDPARVRQRDKLSEFLCRFVMEAEPEHKRKISDKRFINKLLSLPPDDIGGSDMSSFVKDPSYSYKKVLFHGIEFQLILAELLFYLFWDWFFASSFLSAFCCLCLHVLLGIMRKFLGQKNVEKKTLVDARYLL
eukprot:CAMPEP_0113868268 /NCGR_PEP_ID=MMETSP0780_2-20120614/889_1 /TAXON_ID=652834 /ORGANISM="Palpitomonas bilix" /LENGTH=977 /DNA_ID=CAMNT_0000853321 /DNA_START=154 /DNA_END=3087 /DNA_ORIENTATION=- /assembly_acc=CAM_ASM_000599